MFFYYYVFHAPCLPSSKLLPYISVCLWLHCCRISAVRWEGTGKPLTVILPFQIGVILQSDRNSYIWLCWPIPPSSPVLQTFLVPPLLSPVSHFDTSVLQCRPKMGCKPYGPGDSSLTVTNHATEYPVLPLAACWCSAWKDGWGRCFPKGWYNILKEKKKKKKDLLQFGPEEHLVLSLV